MELCAALSIFISFIPCVCVRSSHRRLALNKHPFLSASSGLESPPPQQHRTSDSALLYRTTDVPLSPPPADGKVPAIVVCDNHILFNSLLTLLDCEGHDLDQPFPLYRIVCACEAGELEHCSFQLGHGSCTWDPSSLPHVPLSLAGCFGLIYPMPHWSMGTAP